MRLCGREAAAICRQSVGLADLRPHRSATDEKWIDDEHQLSTPSSIDDERGVFRREIKVSFVWRRIVHDDGFVGHCDEEVNLCIKLTFLPYVLRHCHSWYSIIHTSNCLSSFPSFPSRLSASICLLYPSLLWQNSFATPHSARLSGSSAAERSSSIPKKATLSSSANSSMRRRAVISHTMAIRSPRRTINPYKVSAECAQEMDTMCRNPGRIVRGQALLAL